MKALLDKKSNETKYVNEWEYYIMSEELGVSPNRSSFIASLTRLEACILSKGKDKNLFNLAKAEVLNNPIIKEAWLTDFKTWVEQLDLHETHYSNIEAVINKLVYD